MIQYTTLTQFVEEQITLFNLLETEKNIVAIRNKCTRALKKLGIWDKAESKLIGRKHTKVFTDEQLKQLYQAIEPYLIKRSNIDIEELTAYRKTNNDFIDFAFSIDPTTTQPIQPRTPQVTSQDITKTMITALYEHFFEPIDIEQWNKDLATEYKLDTFEAEDLNSIELFQARKRLENPVKAYVKPRQK